MRRIKWLPMLIAVVLLAACSGGKGTLQFHANGEDFVRQGFVSKDGWTISFDHVYITLSGIEGYQSDPPYDPHLGEEVQAKQKAGLPSTYTVDLAEGDENAEPILVGETTNAAEGQYNAIHWNMVRATEGASKGYALMIVGAAEKDGQTIPFTIEVEDEYAYTCGEYVGDERKGILAKGGSADLEMTFHFDHVFGDAETPLDDELNVGALGFEPFSAVAQGGKVDIDMAGLQSQLAAGDYQMLVDILPTLGHVGEGHCHCETR